MAKARAPGVRWIGGKRVDLVELRKRRKLAKERAVPVEDTRVSDVWARSDARAASAKLDAAEDKARKALPTKQIVKVEKVDNPDFSRDHVESYAGNFRKIDALINVKESAISALVAKKAIDECQAEAAVKFRRLFEAMGGKGASAIDYSREQVDGGGATVAITDQQIDAGRKLKLAHDALTKAHGVYAWKIVIYVCGEGLSIHDMTETRRQRDTLTDNLRQYLDCLAAHWNLSTRQNVSAPQRSLQGLTSRA